MLSFISIWAIGLATGISPWYLDIGLWLAAGFSVFYMWALVIGWRVQGNLMTLYLATLLGAAEGLGTRWLDPLFCMGVWFIPLGVLGYLKRTITLIKREVTQ